MVTTLKPSHVGRYRDIARLILKYGGVDALRRAGLDDGDDPGISGRTVDPADARELAGDLEAMGPTFVKLGQLLSTRADLLPEAYLDALARLQDRVEPVPFADIERIVTEELAMRLDRAFAAFDPVPVASASLGQVHRATLPDGRDVAVKVQRPDIRDQVRKDLEAIDEIATFVDAHTDIGRRYGFAAMVDEFRRSLLAELDYRQEAEHLRTLAEILSDHPLIVVPLPVEDRSTSRVLTMTFVAGRKVTEPSPVDLRDGRGTLLADALLEAYLDQVLEHGFFHADPHPGNVLITDDGRLALVDVGQIARLRPERRDQLLRVLLGISEGDGATVADVCVRMGEPLDGFDRDGFVADVDTLVQRYGGRGIEQLQAGSVIADLARVSGDRGLRAPAELTMLAKALLSLDEVARVLDPTFRPDDAIRRHIAGLVRRRAFHMVSPGNVLSAALEAKEFAERLPQRVNKVFDALAEGRLTLRIEGIDEKELMRSAQKLANRVTMGVVLAAMIVGAAMLMRIQTSSTLFGYPALAIVLFLLAAVGGVALVVSSVLSDLPQHRRRGRRRGR